MTDIGQLDSEYIENNDNGEINNKNEVVIFKEGMADFDKDG